MKGSGSHWIAMGLLIMSAGCGEPVFEHAGSPNSLQEDREACAMEMKKSPATLAYRQNPAAHPDYVSQVFMEMNRCIERKGWKQAKSQQEQTPKTVATPLAQTRLPAPRTDPKAGDNTAGDEWPENGAENK